MSETEKLRALLAEARAAVHLILDIDALQDWACEGVEDEPAVDDMLRNIRQRIDAAIAEPVSIEWPHGSTPGPWGWEHDGGMNPSMAYRIVRSGSTARETTARRPYHALTGTLADAQLIAAAPLQQAALEEARRECDEARAEVERLRALVMHPTGVTWEQHHANFKALVEDEVVEAYQRGAEAMREAAARKLAAFIAETTYDGVVSSYRLDELVADVRAMPLPKEEP
jgi:hypothetical protein